jgi:hypothetical protein
MDLRYPIGKFQWPATVTPAEREQAVQEIEAAPALLRQAVAGLSEVQLETPYRPEGWTVRQLVHHVADSHMNSYIRFRLALTENEPAIKPYDEKLWAKLPDAASAPLEISFQLLEGLHRRWVLLLRSFQEADWARTFKHPEMGNTIRLDGTAMLYSWHSRHHTAHITSLRRRSGW